jgi:hypothetical protein
MNAKPSKPRKKRVFKPRPSRIDRELIDRLREVIDSIGSNLSASKAIARSEGAVRKWLRGESEPSASDMRRLCETSGYSAEWVLFGTDLQGRCERENRRLAGMKRLAPLAAASNP